MQMFNRLDSEITKLKNLKTVENTTEFNNNSNLTSKLPNKCLNNQNKESNIKNFGTFSKYKSKTNYTVDGKKKRTCITLFD